MQTGCFGHSISTASVIVLYLNVVVNFYNTILVTLNYNYLSVIIANDNIKAKLYLVSIQTILSVLAIILLNIKQHNSFIMFFIKYWIFGFTVITLSMELLAVVYSSGLEISNKISQMTTNNERKNESVPEFSDASHVSIGFMLLICYFVFKLHAISTLFRCSGSDFDKNFFSEDNATHNNDIERNTPSSGDEIVLSLLPPSYDELMESELQSLPSYSEVCEH